VGSSIQGEGQGEGEVVQRFYEMRRCSQGVTVSIRGGVGIGGVGRCR
jgi:hypothetical protein